MHCLSHRHLVCHTQTTTTRRLKARSLVTKNPNLHCRDSNATAGHLWRTARRAGWAICVFEVWHTSPGFGWKLEAFLALQDLGGGHGRHGRHGRRSASAQKDAMLMMRANRPPGPRPLSFITTARLPSGNWVIKSARGTSYPSGPLPCLIWLEVERDPSATTTSPTPDIARAHTTKPVVYGLRRYNGKFTAVPHSTI